jgi:hypothetical protein
VSLAGEARGYGWPALSTPGTVLQEALKFKLAVKVSRISSVEDDAVCSCGDTGCL